MSESRGRMRQPQRVGAFLQGFIDPRPTEYSGHRMRSRLEVDFAAHLDRMGVSWTYEPAIFGDVGKGYLPDFYITSAGAPCFVEVKPTRAEVSEAKRRMAVIWEVYPDAVLLVACAEGSAFFAARKGEPWHEWAELWRHA